MSGLFTRNRVIGLVFAAFIAIVDQAIKAYVTVTLGINQIGDKMDLLPFFDLTYTENRGISLGMLQATNMEMRWLLVLMTAVIALVVFVWMLREKLMGDILGLAMILGGAIGNIYDRYTYGYVIDFADFHIGDFRPFLIFNVADAAITIGVVIILARSLFLSEKDDNEMDASGVPSEN
ncbi:signal peptidase II [Erythrobacter crassostreae]|uniref:Lipoprotein signal peptidase n=1 Tax=Erythrobacter crassostreae TaxID=2828328 RepID=A0A9X1F1N7_9SPHN|nr:signal peptidase II [Erythrobacter crassostrea]MBV7258482.1 signal peptidase II [Erythrobacter crassostrea]